jgi:hypothetical protein
METPLERAKELAEQIYELTKALVLTGEKEQEEAEVEAYTILLDEREPLIEELTDLRQQMDESEVSSPEFEEIKQTIAKITELDKMHLRFMQHKHKGAQASYKEIKIGQRIHAGYNPLPGNEVSSKFDVKQ